MSNNLFFILAFAFVVTSCHQKRKKEPETIPQKDIFISPPVSGTDIHLEEYSVDAGKGGTLFYKTGSIIFFPPNSFVDKDGKTVQGKVTVKYREFADPIDFYLAGIPMDYDSSGTKYTFESSGMCEILAYK
ncbi:MAG TPA: hypothetical protein VGB71_11410, partial [Flavisolibacter sp.]